jgi:hypothetical protein
MSASALRCVVCGRLKPKGARWSTFVDAMRGGTRAICGVACLKRQQAGKRDQPKEKDR